MTGKTPYRAAFAAVTLALGVACSAGDKAAPPAIDTLAAAGKSLTEAMAADRAFSDYAQTAGMAEAFGKYMDAVDGAMISPGEVTTGEAAIRAAFKDWPADLKMAWSPDIGHGSAGGDMAVTSGRWKRERAGQAVAEGRYVTVWRKNAAGEWKGVVDIGAPDPAPQPPAVATPDKPDMQGRPG